MAINISTTVLKNEENGEVERFLKIINISNLKSVKSSIFYFKSLLNQKSKLVINGNLLSK